ncbi:FtsW/RodA/SpoVE family cell cycle protein [Paenibacillus rhizovicinus]|uniref:FtsW/RodA/SpoVE family cell cycle protein n=1 Tax=Paenibacillus rhizovicinus TaxID=2704463 RepID=A0A6C0P1U5_9BACL|nr:FtsW/RodA/SpoVE family cell cycle protein [Paenibacillus rhizovicinus]QHW32435.1 FtsW/RodA/SpoVE family cell cycle protein [Paenibacillus rhizovicinus]
MDVVQLDGLAHYRGGAGVMGDIGRHAAVSRYLDRLCAQIKAKAMHEEIRLEMQSHLEELIDEKVDRHGKSEDEAVHEALLQMGDPEEVGKQLHQAHKPRTEWSVIALTACMLLLGVIASFSLNAALDGQLAIGRKLVFAGMGIAVMGSLYFIDYRRLLNVSGAVYAGTLLLMAAVQWHGTQLNGAKQWIMIGAYTINICAAAPYLLIIAVAGLLHNAKSVPSGDWMASAKRSVFGGVVYVVLPVFLFLSAPAVGYLIIYLFGVAVLLLMNRQWKLLLTGLSIFALLLFYVQKTYNSDLWRSVWERHMAFLHRDESTAYHTVRSIEAIHSGGMWGQGFGAPTRTLPDIAGQFTYSYLVYSLGWVFGIAVAVLALFFVSRMILMGMKLSDGYARNLVIGLSVVLGIQYLWNVLMCLGMFPVLGGMQLPILNWNANTCLELGALGLMLSAYRRKDMLGGAHHAPMNQA